MYIVTERQKQIAADDILVPIPATMYEGVFRGSHDIALSKATFLLARAARNEKETLRDVVSRILLMSCKRIINLKGYDDFVFETTLNGDNVRLRGKSTAGCMTIMLESEDV